MKPFKLFALTFVLILAVSACSLPGNVPAETAIPSPTVAESPPQSVETATPPAGNGDQPPDRHTCFHNGSSYLVRTRGVY